MTLSALLLAGGESSRMGRDKATIEVDGRPLWERQLEMLRDLRADKTFVSARSAPSWLPDTVELLVDDEPSRGPLSGLTKGLTAMQTTHLLVLAVDMPFMTAGELRNLLECAKDGCGVVPTIADRAEPLAAIYPAEATTDFQAALRGSVSSLQPLVRKLAATGKIMLSPLSTEAARLYRSVNEPGDLKL
ncbi:MAG TPA: molybdenum cofactor guanylyltransferase [Chthoniobacterales bacterium]|jgi:molybdopterin-guanine dinucleotide biosynthesis protein A|nr:molybdenum cofactor guanylyltransferase [Chthoniobacterales bacterium]